MKKIVSTLLFVVVCLTMMNANNHVSATSWAELDPQEVNERAKVIVSGQYDFSSKPIQSGFIFQGMAFNVDNVYKGDVPKQIIAGIDQFDVGWAEEFQNEGGEFLLFLEESEKAEFLTPVGGPNGMVQVLEGKVVGFGKENNAFYDKILNGKSNSPTIEIENTKQSLTSIIILVISGGILIGLTVFYIIYRTGQKRY